MADQKISELTALTGANVADDDAIAIVDTSATETKKIVFSELKNALDTATGFVRITGDTMTGDLSMGDNVKAIFGAGSDLQIYHDGNSKITDVGDGKLELHSNGTGVTIQKGATEYMAQFLTDGAVTLYYDNAAKLATTSTGIDVTGTAKSTAVTTTNNGITLQSGSVTKSAINIAASTNQGINGTAAGDQYNWTTGGKMLWSTNNGTNAHLVLDASGNLLVGKTAAGIANTGSEFSSTGRAFFTFDGGGPLQLNRKTSDGDIIELHKDGTEVGSIGVSGNDFYVTGSVTNIAGAYFANSKIMPMKSGATSDATIDLGTSSKRFQNLYLSGGINNGTNAIAFSGGAFAGDGSGNDANIDLGRTDRRFQNLYLSGGVHLGGTGADNKLDDYEIGYFTTSYATSGSGTITVNPSYDQLRYVKMGSFVHVQGIARISSVSSPTGIVYLMLPFTAENLNEEADYSGSTVWWYENGTGWNETAIRARTLSNSQLFQINKDASTISANDEFLFGIQYTTSA